MLRTLTIRVTSQVATWFRTLDCDRVCDVRKFPIQLFYNIPWGYTNMNALLV